MTDPERGPLIIVGDVDGAVCDGDFCDVPEQRDEGIVDDELNSPKI